VSEVRTPLNTFIGGTTGIENSWLDVFNNDVWGNSDKWIKAVGVFIDVAMEYEISFNGVSGEDLELTLPFVVRTSSSLIKEVWLDGAKRPIKPVVYGDKFKVAVIPTESLKFFYADEKKLPQNILRRKSISLFGFNSKLIFSALTSLFVKRFLSVLSFCLTSVSFIHKLLRSVRVDSKLVVIGSSEALVKRSLSPVAYLKFVADYYTGQRAIRGNSYLIISGSCIAGTCHLTTWRRFYSKWKRCKSWKA